MPHKFLLKGLVRFETEQLVQKVGWRGWRKGGICKAQRGEEFRAGHADTQQLPGKLARKHSVRMYVGSALRRRHWENFMIIRIPDESRDSDLDLADSQTCAFWVPGHLPEEEEEEEGSHDVRKMVSVTDPCGLEARLGFWVSGIGKFPTIGPRMVE